MARAAGGKAKAGVFFPSNVGPAATYGAEVEGLSNTEVRKLRRLALGSRPPFTVGRPATASLAMSGDPTALAAAAPS